ncbi:MAG: methyltransferase [Pseudomonadota bacterium]
MSSLEPDLTRDDFLGGKLTLFQPRSGYRAGIDPVLLAASVEAEAGQTLLDLGCGVGAAALCAARRLPGLHVAGLEVQDDYAALARRNGVQNGIEFDVLTGDLAQMPDVFKARQFDHVIANPPYFERRKSTASDVPTKERALGEDTPLSDWVRQATKRASPGGTVTFIQRIERLPDMLTEFQLGLGSLECLPLAPRYNKPPRLMLLRGKKGGRADFRLCPAQVLHEGAAHDGDRESYTSSIASVLRDGAALPFS